MKPDFKCYCDATYEGNLLVGYPSPHPSPSVS
jgi:hypothetical protein